MANLVDHLGVVARAPDKAAFAFFDVDETLVSFKTMVSFHEYYLTHAGGVASTVVGPLRVAWSRALLARQESQGRSREFINAAYYRHFRGASVEKVRKSAHEWFETMRRTTTPFYYPATLLALETHRAIGREPVLVSGSAVDILSPIAEELKVKHILATRPEQENGRYTGAIRPPQTIGAGKARVITEFLASNGGSAKQSFAYGDHDSDIPMLSAVGHPVIVSRRSQMLTFAQARSWAAIDPLEECNTWSMEGGQSRLAMTL